eukprot:c19792_g1_i1 orf=2-202(-)
MNPSTSENKSLRENNMQISLIHNIDHNPSGLDGCPLPSLVITYLEKSQRESYKHLEAHQLSLFHLRL